MANDKMFTTADKQLDELFDKNVKVKFENGKPNFTLEYNGLVVPFIGKPESIHTVKCIFEYFLKLEKIQSNEDFISKNSKTIEAILSVPELSSGDMSQTYMNQVQEILDKQGLV